MTHRAKHHPKNPPKHVAKHRGTPAHAHLADKPKKALGATLLMSTVAVGTTGAAVAGGVALSASPESTIATDSEQVAVPASAMLAAADDDLVARITGSQDGERVGTVSRSADRRASTDPLKSAALDATAQGPADSGSQDLADADPRLIAQALLGEFGFGLDQFGCLDSLYTRESGWNPYADNPSSSAYGIPQALPGSKMASAGADWATNPVTQIRWGLGYIQDRYGSPCSAWAHSQSHGWY
ncbi:lytic transglycosylase domain-containing protein [Nocardioides sp.]|uniref:aggregation-promoting factor C-terminal-like domain-containing protein n=1 Tax=Nocardioides sp. TaxID=35761 RepID=UPI003513A3DC